MSEKTYFLCSQAVIDRFPEAERSKPFKSGYRDDDDKYYVALLDFEEADKHYREVVEPNNDDEDRNYIDYWLRGCAPGLMDISKIRLVRALKNGLFVEMEMKTGLTKETNRALMIYELAKKFNCTPIELINKIAS